MRSPSIITIFFLLLATNLLAQGHSVTGVVRDASRQVLPYAGVSLQQVPDTTKAYYTGANEAGAFFFDNIPTAEYTIKVSAMGYSGYKSQVSVIRDTVLEGIILTETAQQLETVAVNAKRPIVKRKADRLEFNVENSNLSSENAWEILRKTPGVTVAGDGLSIRGSQGILVTINDKKVYLTGTELKNLLENTNGEDIKAIEVITTPPARYEAQGSAVLNIKMKKAIAPGYKGSLSGAYVQSTYPKGVMSTNHYYKNNKFSVYGGYMFGSGHYLNNNDRTVQYFDEAGQVQQTWKSSEQTHSRAESQNSYNITTEYQIDSLNTVSIGANGFFSLKSTANVFTNTDIYNASMELDSLFRTHNRRDYPQKNNTVNFAYEHKFNADNKIILSSDYTQHHFTQSQGNDSDFMLPDGTPYRSSSIISDDNRRITLFSAQADYTGKAWAFNMEAGVRYGLVNADNDFEYHQENTGQTDIDMANRFLYDENIAASYLSFEREIGKWSFKAGLRAEYTNLEGNSEATGEVNGQEYLKFFPSAYVLYKPADKHQVGITYGKRIVRPQYAMLNPFRVYSTPYAYNTGDPALQPALAHNLGLNYTFKDKYFFDLYYGYEKDPSMELTYQDYETNTLVTKFTNTKKNTYAGLSFNTNTVFFEWWEQSWQASGGYFENNFQGPDGGLYTNKRWNYSANTNARFTLSKDKNWLGEANFYYQSASAMGAYEMGDISGLSLSIRKKFWDGKAELFLILSDVYKGEGLTFTTNYANQFSYSNSYDDNRSFRLQFRYRFGNQKLGDKQARQDAEEKSRL